MAILKTYRLPSFSVIVRELHDDERSQATDNQRDYMTVAFIHKPTGHYLNVVIGSPVYGEWNEDRAARSAISFASEPSCWDTDKDREWSEWYGETLTNEAFSHTVLGKELRE